MYYVSGYNPYDNVVSVVDTGDASTEYYKREGIRAFLDRGIEIRGAIVDSCGRLRLRVVTEEVKLELLNTAHNVLGVAKYIKTQSGVYPIFTNVGRLLRISDCVTYIDDKAFQACDTSLLEEVVLPKNCLRIGKYTFSRCRNLSKLALNEGLEAIESNALRATKVSKIYIPESVKTIQYHGINTQSSNAVKLVLPRRLVILGPRFSSAMAIKMPDSVEFPETRYPMFETSTRVLAINSLYGGICFENIAKYTADIMLCTDDKYIAYRASSLPNSKVVPYNMFDAVCERSGIS